MSKIIKLQKLASKLKKLKKNKVVLCHGVFDIIHHGHIKYFEEANDFICLSVFYRECKYCSKFALRLF